MSRSIVTFQSLMGSGGLPPAIQPRRAAFHCQITAAGTVTVAAGRVYQTYIGPAFDGEHVLLHGYQSLGATAIASLANNDVIGVKAALIDDEAIGQVDDDNAVSGGDTSQIHTRFWTITSLSITKNETTPLTNELWWRLVTYRANGSYRWLELHYEGDIHWTTPSAVINDLNPPPP